MTTEEQSEELGVGIIGRRSEYVILIQLIFNYTSNIPNTNNLYLVVWFQVFLSNPNNSMVSSIPIQSK